MHGSTEKGGKRKSVKGNKKQRVSVKEWRETKCINWLVAFNEDRRMKPEECSRRDKSLYALQAITRTVCHAPNHRRSNFLGTLNTFLSRRQAQRNGGVRPVEIKLMDV